MEKSTEKSKIQREIDDEGLIATNPMLKSAFESHERSRQLSPSSPPSSSTSYKEDRYSWNCREELDSHVSCVKLFLEDHVKYGTTYYPGTDSADDPCKSTRSLYMRCAHYRKKNPVNALSVLPASSAPKPCSMELNMHGNCVERQLERSQKLGEKYWTQGGEDKCRSSRDLYESCMYRYDTSSTPYDGDDFKTMVHKNVRAFDFRPYKSGGS